MQTEHYVLTQSPLTFLEAWQDAIDAEVWPLRLVGYDGSLITGAIVQAELKGLPTEFVLEFLTREQFAALWNFAAVPASWRYHVRIAGRRFEPLDLRMRSAIASVTAACAYGIRTDGAWCTPSTERRNPQEMSKVREGFRQQLLIWLEVFVDTPSVGPGRR